MIETKVPYYNEDQARGEALLKLAHEFAEPGFNAADFSFFFTSVMSSACLGSATVENILRLCVRNYNHMRKENPDHEVLPGTDREPDIAVYDLDSFLDRIMKRSH